MRNESRLTPDQAEALERARAVIAERAVEVDERGEFPHENFKTLGELGILGYCFSTELGGWGAGPSGDMRLFVEIIETLSAACSSTGQCLAVHGHSCAMVELLGTDEQRALFADEVINQHAVLATYGSEPTQRINADGHRLNYNTIAERTATGWRVDGRKFFTTNSPGANWHFFQAMTEVDGEWLMSLPYTRAPDPAVTVHGDWNNMGQRATGSGSVTVAGLEIPADQMIGEPGAFYRYGQMLYASFQLSFVAEFMGMAAGALEFGKYWLTHEAKPPAGLPSLGHDPHVQRLVGELEVALDACRALLRNAADFVEASRDDEDLRAEAFNAVIRAKVLATETVLRVTNDVFQFTGARSTSKRFGADRFWRNARTLTLHDVLDRQKAIAGRHALGITEASTVFASPRAERAPA